MNVVLTGFMTTGKTSVGKILARRLGYAFFDTDDMIEKETGHSIAEIFSKSSEAAFRELETRTVQLLSALDHAVIATGGGVPLKDSHMIDLEKNGFVVCLTAAPATVLSRLRGDAAVRPLLQGDEPLRRIEELLAARARAYARCGASVATDGLTVDQVADRVAAALPKDRRP